MSNIIICCYYTIIDKDNVNELFVFENQCKLVKLVNARVISIDESTYSVVKLGNLEIKIYKADFPDGIVVGDVVDITGPIIPYNHIAELRVASSDDIIKKNTVDLGDEYEEIATLDVNYTNIDCEVDAISIITDTSIKLHKDGSWYADIPCSWRTIVVVDEDGKIAYAVYNPDAGYGGPSSQSYITVYDDYTTNPAITIFEGYGPWTVENPSAYGKFEIKAPEGGFAIVAQGTGAIELYDAILDEEVDSMNYDYNSRQDVEDIRLYYDEVTNTIKVYKYIIDENDLKVDIDNGQIITYPAGTVLKDSSGWTYGEWANYMIVDEDGVIAYNVWNAGCGYGGTIEYIYANSKYANAENPCFVDGNVVVPEGFTGIKFGYVIIDDVYSKLTGGQITHSYLDTVGAWSSLAYNWNSINNQYISQNARVYVFDNFLVVNNDGLQDKETVNVKALVEANTVYTSTSNEITLGDITIAVDQWNRVIYASYTVDGYGGPADGFYHDGTYECVAGETHGIFALDENFAPWPTSVTIGGEYVHAWLLYSIVVPSNGKIITGSVETMIPLINKIFDANLSSDMSSWQINIFFESELVDGTYNHIVLDFNKSDETVVTYYSVNVEIDGKEETYNVKKGETISLTAPSKEGYVFSKWVKIIDNVTENYSTSSDIDVVITESAKYKAIYVVEENTDLSWEYINVLTLENVTLNNGDTSLSVFTSTEALNAVTVTSGKDKWIGNGWRTILTFDGEGRLVLFCHNPAYAGLNPTSIWYAHNSVYTNSNDNPAFAVSGNDWTLAIPQGGFVMSMHTNYQDDVFAVFGLNKGYVGDSHISDHSKIDSIRAFYFPTSNTIRFYEDVVADTDILVELGNIETYTTSNFQLLSNDTNGRNGSSGDWNWKFVLSADKDGYICYANAYFANSWIYGDANPFTGGTHFLMSDVYFNDLENNPGCIKIDNDSNFKIVAPEGGYLLYATAGDCSDLINALTNGNIKQINDDTQAEVNDVNAILDDTKIRLINNHLVVTPGTNTEETLQATIYTHDSESIELGDYTIAIDANGKIIFASRTSDGYGGPVDGFYHDGTYYWIAGQVCLIFDIQSDFVPWSVDEGESGCYTHYTIVCPEGCTIITGSIDTMIPIIDVIICKGFGAEYLMADNSNIFAENYPDGTFNNRVFSYIINADKTISYYFN